MPTVLSFANDGKVNVDTPLDGRELTELAAGRSAGDSDRVISEYSDMGVCAPCRMIREGQYKYIYVHGHPAMLFDLESDPLEHENLSGRAQWVEIENRLRATLLDGWDPEEINSQILESQVGRELIWAVTKNSSKRDNWSYEMRRGDKQRYVRGGGDAEGTVAVKGRARFPYVAPVLQDKAQAILAERLAGSPGHDGGVTTLPGI